MSSSKTPKLRNPLRSKPRVELSARRTGVAFLFVNAASFLYSGKLLDPKSDRPPDYEAFPQPVYFKEGQIADLSPELVALAPTHAACNSKFAATSRSQHEIILFTRCLLAGFAHCATRDGLAVRDRKSGFRPVSYTHLRAHETRHDLVC